MELTFHESDNRLELYALGRLPETEIEQVEEHLILCEGCRHRLEETSDFALALREELRRPAPLKSSFAEWFTMPRIAMAGAFAAIILAVGVYSFESGRNLAPIAALQLTAMRGQMQTVHAAREIDLTLTDAPATGPFKVDVVDALGGKVWSGVPETAPRGLIAKVSGVSSPGDYFVRLYGPNGELLHEYGFHADK